MVVRDASALGGPEDIYRLTWVGNVNNPETTTEFRNGQFWRLEVYNPANDPTGDPMTGDEGWTTVYSQLNPKHDLVSGLGAGDEYVVFEIGGGLHLLYDLNGGLSKQPTTLTYLQANENGALDRGDNDGQLDFEDARSVSIFCFARGTLIATPEGERAIETLSEGMQVLTRDAGPQPIRWIGSCKLSAGELQQKPALRPVRIGRGALGQGLPCRDLIVSPQHRVLVRSRIAQRMFGASEVLVAAKLLLDLDNVSICTRDPDVEYFHVMFDEHQIVLSEGAETESFFPGPQAMRSVGAAARAEIVALFPDLVARCARGEPCGARPFAAGRKGRNLLARHQKSAKALVSDSRLSA